MTERPQWPLENILLASPLVVSPQKGLNRRDGICIRQKGRARRRHSSEVEDDSTSTTIAVRPWTSLLTFLGTQFPPLLN